MLENMLAITSDVIAWNYKLGHRHLQATILESLYEWQCRDVVMEPQHPERSVLICHALPIFMYTRGPKHGCIAIVRYHFCFSFPRNGYVQNYVEVSLPKRNLHTVLT